MLQTTSAGELSTMGLLTTSFSPPLRYKRLEMEGQASYEKVPLYKQIFKRLESCPDAVACMTRASKGGFAYISWKVAYHTIEAIQLPCSQIYQQDIIARNFIDGYGKKQIYQVQSYRGV